MNPRDRRELQFAAVPFSECRLPFTPGQRVYQLRRPESGSLIVERCEQYADGTWRVKALDHYAYGLTPVSITAPAEYFRALPSNWTEPPPCPIESTGYDACGEVRRRELHADPAYHARVMGWCDTIKERSVAFANSLQRKDPR